METNSYLFQGQRYDWQDAPRGHPGFDLVPGNFIHFLQNHDQIANSGSGVRMDKLASLARVCALTALLLLRAANAYAVSGPGSNGRIDFLKQFPSLKDPAFAEWMTTPFDLRAFEAQLG